MKIPRPAHSPPLRSNSKMPVLCSRPLQGGPFCRARWLFPEQLPTWCVPGAAVAAASIKLPSARISNRPVLVLQRQGICQFCLCANLALLGVLRLRPTQKEIVFTSLHSPKMTRNNHKKGTKGLQINRPSLAPLTAKI